MLRLILAAAAVAFAWLAGRATERALWEMACETPTPEPTFAVVSVDLPEADTYIGALMSHILHPERS